jgi:hypothetical protein
VLSVNEGQHVQSQVRSHLFGNDATQISQKDDSRSLKVSRLLVRTSQPGSCSFMLLPGTFLEGVHQTFPIRSHCIRVMPGR